MTAHSGYLTTISFEDFAVWMCVRHTQKRDGPGCPTSVTLGGIKKRGRNPDPILIRYMYVTV